MRVNSNWRQDNHNMDTKSNDTSITKYHSKYNISSENHWAGCNCWSRWLSFYHIP